MQTDLTQTRRSHVGLDSAPGFRLGSGTQGCLTAVSRNCLQIEQLHRFERYAVPLKQAISLHAGDLAEVRLRRESGTDLNGRFDCGFQSGLVLAANRTVSSVAELSAVVTLRENVVLTEFYLTKNNTGNYVPAEPCRCHIALLVNGVELI